jgi:hypothetical protein
MLHDRFENQQEVKSASHPLDRIFIFVTLISTKTNIIHIQSLSKFQYYGASILGSLPNSPIVEIFLL